MFSCESGNGTVLAAIDAFVDRFVVSASKIKHGHLGCPSDRIPAERRKFVYIVAELNRTLPCDNARLAIREPGTGDLV